LDGGRCTADAGTLGTERQIPHPRTAAGHQKYMNPLRLLVDAFVNTFGITPPTPETEARAGRVIAAMLGAVLILLVGVGWLLRSAFTR
jgi:hypothetical protein